MGWYYCFVLITWFLLTKWSKNRDSYIGQKSRVRKTCLSCICRSWFWCLHTSETSSVCYQTRRICSDHGVSVAVSVMGLRSPRVTFYTLAIGFPITDIILCAVWHVCTNSGNLDMESLLWYHCVYKKVYRIFKRQNKIMDIWCLHLLLI